MRKTCRWGKSLYFNGKVHKNGCTNLKLKLVPFILTGMVLGSAWFNEQVLLCDMVATVCIVACVTALFSIGGDGFSRFCHICHPATYHKIFTLRNNILISLGFWVVGITMSLPALLGWTDNVYDPKYLECIWNRKYSLSYTIFFSSGVVATPISIIAISYLKIFWHVRRSRIAMSNAGYCPGAISCVVTNLDHKAIQDQRPIPNKSAALSLKLAKSLSIVFLGFVICWTPYAVIVVADFEDRLPEELHLFALLLAHLHSTINCVIYALTNAQFRAGYRFLMGKIFPCICQSIRIHASAVGTQAMASQQ